MRQIGFRKRARPKVLLVKEARDPQPGVNHLSSPRRPLPRSLGVSCSEKLRVPARDQKGRGVRGLPGKMASTQLASAFKKLLKTKSWTSALSQR